MPNAADFWDKVAEKYATSPIKNMEAYEATLAKVRTHLKPEMNVLEVACGTGTTALKLADAVDRYTATDVSPNMIEIGRGKAQDEGASNVTFATATLEDNDFQPGTFDALMSFDFFHLAEDLPGAVGAAHNLLKPGGLFISKTPCLGAKFSIFPLILPVMRMLGKAPYVAFLKVADLEGTIANAGFEIVSAENIPEGRANRFVVARKV